MFASFIWLTVEQWAAKSELNMSEASAKQIKAFDAVSVKHGDILITRAGSNGRVAMITPELAGAVVSNDAIRVRIAITRLRSYGFTYLQTEQAQSQLKRNEYGAVQQHLEAHHVAYVLIPIPDNWDTAQPVPEWTGRYRRSCGTSEIAAGMVNVARSKVLPELDICAVEPVAATPVALPPVVHGFGHEAA